MHRVAMLIVVTLGLAACASTPHDPGEPTLATTEAGQATAEPEDDSEETAEQAPEEPVGSVTISGTDDLTWATPEVSAPAGLLEITLECGPGSGHTLFIPDVDANRQLLGCSAGATSTTLVTIDSGTYPYRCTVAGHQNMRGTLTVG